MWWIKESAESEKEFGEPSPIRSVKETLEIEKIAKNLGWYHILLLKRSLLDQG